MRPSSLTRDWTQAPYIGDRILTTGPPRKSHCFWVFNPWILLFAIFANRETLDPLLEIGKLEKGAVHGRREKGCVGQASIGSVDVRSSPLSALGYQSYNLSIRNKNAQQNEQYWVKSRETQVSTLRKHQEIDVEICMYQNEGPFILSGRGGKCYRSHLKEQLRNQAAYCEGQG